MNLTTGTLTINRVKGSNSSVQELDRHKGEPLLDSTLAIRLWLKERSEDGSQILFPSQKGGMLTRPHSSLGYRPPAPAAITPLPLGSAPLHPSGMALGLT